MNTKLRKVLIILIIILIIALIGLLIYNFFIKKPENGNGPGSGGLPGGEQGDFIPGQEDFIPSPELKIKAISADPVLSPTLTKDKSNVIYYHTDGEVWRSNFDGSGLTQVSDAALDDLVKIIWSPDKDMVISIFEDSAGNVAKYSYSYTTGKATPLDTYINYITWSPSNKIAYQYQNNISDVINISTANPDGSGYTELLRTRMKNLILEWPKGSEIFFREKPTGLAQSSLYSLNSLTKTFTKVISNTYGFSIKWSADGNKILYSKTDSNAKNIRIMVSDRSGANQKSANVNTLAEKCVWSQDPRIIYCAISKNLQEANILPDDFYKGTFSSIDSFYKINVETGETTKLLEETTEKYDAVDLLLSPQESYLLFVNKNNGLLYSISLD